MVFQKLIRKRPKPWGLSLFLKQSAFSGIFVVNKKSIVDNFSTENRLIWLKIGYSDKNWAFMLKNHLFFAFFENFLRHFWPRFLKFFKILDHCLKKNGFHCKICPFRFLLFCSLPGMPAYPTSPRGPLSPGLPTAPGNPGMPNVPDLPSGPCSPGGPCGPRLPGSPKKRVNYLLI